MTETVLEEEIWKIILTDDEAKSEKQEIFKSWRWD